MSLFFELLRAAALLTAVAVIAYGASRYAAERWRERAQGRRLEVIEALSVGPRRHVCLLRVGQEDVLCVGLSEHGITPLARFRGADARRLAAGPEDGEDARA